MKTMNDQNTAKSRELYAYAKRGKWEEVIEKYKEVLKEHKNNPGAQNNPGAKNPKLNRRGDTVLHLAVIDNQEARVEELVRHISEAPKNTLTENQEETEKRVKEGTDNYKDILETTNERGNNPLHLAAVMGSVRMCEAIGSKHNGLVDMRNNDDETPLFLAAAYGNKDAFFCLYNFCKDDASRISANCRVKQDGDTVLHQALRNEHLGELSFLFFSSSQV